MNSVNKIKCVFSICKISTVKIKEISLAYTIENPVGPLGMKLL